MQPSPEASPAPVDDNIPDLRYGAYVEKEGYIVRKSAHGQNAFFHLNRKQRYLVIRGSSLSCFKRKGDEEPEWELPLQNSNITSEPERLKIVIRVFDTVEEFVAHDKDDFHNWYTALKEASEKSIQDHYVFVRELGQGQFGKVLLAKDRHTMDKFAVKVIRKNHARERSMVLIKRELKILRMLNHSNIVRLYDLFDTSDKQYFVLEYMSGGALYTVSSPKLFTEERASLILRDVLRGLAYLHGKNIAHRDVKPENILTTDSQWPFTSKLADFGLSNFLNQGAQLESRVGTPYYCSHEVVMDRPYGLKADMWSLGVVAFEMLSGRKPFDGKYTISVLSAIKDGRWTFPSPEFDNISTKAKDFIRSLICVNDNRRLSAAQALNHPWIANQGKPEQKSK